MVRGDRSVDVFVRKLRQKLRVASPHWGYIHTHFGVGYRFAPEPEALIATSLPADFAARHARPPLSEVATEDLQRDTALAR